MAKEKENLSAKEAQSPFKGQFPNPNKIMCKDCKFRDRSTINVGNREILVGTTKDFCEVFKEPPASNGKPHDVLFEEGICEFYSKEV